MDTIPQPTGQTGGERQRDMLARAEQHRRAQQCRARSRTTHQAEPPEQHLGLALRMMARLRTVMPHTARDHPDGALGMGALDQRQAGSPTQETPAPDR